MRGKRGIFFRSLLGLLMVFFISFSSAASILDELHLNVQTVDSSGNVVSGTFDFQFDISTTSDCSNVVYTDSATLTTDSRGIISYYLSSASMDYGEQYYLCYYRDTELIDTAKIARSPYAFRAKYVNVSGIQVDSNLDLSGYNLSADYLIGDGSGLTNLNVSAIDASGINYWNKSGSSLYYSGGNVGIGTDSPQDLLVVNGSSGQIRFGGANGRTLSAYNSAGTGLSNFDFYASQTYFNSDFLIAGGKKISTANGVSDNLYLTTTDSNYGIYTDRNVGIGTDSPGEKLTINGGNLEIESLANVADSGPYINFVESGYSDRFGIFAEMSGSGDGNRLMFTSSSLGDVPNVNDAMMTLLQGGNVGIGTTSPQEKLHVAGNAVVNGTINTDSNKIINLANGTAAQDAVTKSQLDAVNSQLSGNVSDNYVPYVGATQNVDLGEYRLGAGNFKYDDANRSILVGSETSSNLQDVTGLGYMAGSNNVGSRGTFVGSLAGESNSGDYLSSLGYLAGSLNSGTSLTAVGAYSGYDNEGHYSTFMGYNAGRENIAERVSAFGYYSGYQNQGLRSTGIGMYSIYQNKGDYVVGVGYDAARNNSANNVVAIGYQAGKDNTLDNQFIVQQASVNAAPLIQGDFVTGDVVIDGKLSGLANGTAAQDAVTLSQLQGTISQETESLSGLILSVPESSTSSDKWVKVGTLDFSGLTWHTLVSTYRVTSKFGSADYEVRMSVSSPENNFESPHIYKVSSVGASVPQLELYEVDGTGIYELYLKWDSNYIQASIFELSYSEKIAGDHLRMDYEENVNWLSSLSGGRTQVDLVNYFNLKSGNVGIGTNNPSQKLEVSGNANVTQNLTISGMTIYKDTNGDMVFRA